jgi:cytochrome c-type biogenesis protein CcmH
MIWFWVAIAVLTAVVVRSLARPLLQPLHGETSRNLFDAGIYRDQLAELERDLARGLIDPRAAEAARIEISRRLLAVARTEEKIEARTEEKTAEKTAQDLFGSAAPRRTTFLVLAFFLPLSALGIYLALGRPDLPGQPLASRTPAAEAIPPQVREMVARLDRRLHEQPNDPDGWRLLASSYRRLGEIDKSLEAWRQLQQLNPADLGVRAALAETLVAAADGQVTEEAHRLFKELVAEEAENPMARYFLALAQAQAGDLRGALVAWQALAKESPSEAPWLPLVQHRIAEISEMLKK